MKKTFIKKLITLTVIFVLTLTTSLMPVSAYSSQEVEDIPIVEMIQGEDGVYHFEIPLETTVNTFNSGDSKVAPLKDCSHEFTTKLIGNYYADSNHLQMITVVTRVSGTGLITFIEGTFDYTQYAANGTFIRNGYNYDQRYTKEYTTVATISADFDGIVATANESFSLATEGNFTLVDGYGTFKGQAKLAIR